MQIYFNFEKEKGEAMQVYSKGFARIYNDRWGKISTFIAPHIHKLYSSTKIGATNFKVLDLCCGTGNLANYFLKLGYQVIGLDLSSAMLKFARERNKSFIENGQSKFVKGDAIAFTFEEKFGLVLSISDSLNHLNDLDSLRSCFRCVYNVTENNGWFIFDLNTKYGLKRRTGIIVEDHKELMLVNRGVYDEEINRAYIQVSGFRRRRDGLYERFEETVYNTQFPIKDVHYLLREIGWKNVCFYKTIDLEHPISEPEKEGTVVVASYK